MLSESHVSRASIALLGLLSVHFGAGRNPLSNPGLAGIAHAAFRVSDVAKSRQFYNKLGFEQAFEFDDPGKPPVSYTKVNDRQFIELYGRSDASQPLGLMHVCYEAADIEALRKDYATRGVVAPESKKARAGNLLFSIHDPDSQIIEYTEYLPGSLHYEDRGKHLSKQRVSELLLRVITPVTDPAAAIDFYVKKLGFEVMAGEDEPRLRLPGSSGEELGFEKTTPEARPKIAFVVQDVERAARDLRARGLDVNATPQSASVADPDGTVVEFVPMPQYGAY